jgi:hypothetical protein
MGQMSILQYVSEGLDGSYTLLKFKFHVNPMAPINRIFESRIGILMSFYAEVLGQVVIVNPPRLLNALMKAGSLYFLGCILLTFPPLLLFPFLIICSVFTDYVNFVAD